MNAFLYLNGYRLARTADEAAGTVKQVAASLMNGPDWTAWVEASATSL